MSDYVFYKGGPRAYKGGYFWIAHNLIQGLKSDGCTVARIVGVSIPNSTYHNALLKVSQSGRYNDTAILPLEV